MDAPALPARMTADSDAARPLAIEEPSNRWLIHPISRALLAPAIRLGIHPNAVSLTGLALGAGAAFCYAHWRDPRMATLGLLLMLGWHVADGLDGKLARATGRTSPLGRVLDGMCDYLVFIVVLVAVALNTDNVRLAVALGIPAGFAHSVQSAWYEGARDNWIRRAAGHFTVRPRPTTGGWLTWGYHRMEALLAARERPIDRVLAAHPERRAAYLTRSAAVLRPMAIFSANARTFALWIACMAGLPLAYWIWELFVLTALMPVFILALRRVEAQAGG